MDDRYYQNRKIAKIIVEKCNITTCDPRQKPMKFSSKNPAAACYSRALEYNFQFDCREEYIMEAERLNTLSALLADLAGRETELRGYL